MKLALFAILGASLVTAGAAQAHQGRAHHNAASSHVRAQTWYSDTGWQPGTSAINTYGYNYGYGGASHSAPVVIAAPYPGPVYAPQPQYGQAYYGVQRSQPYGYVVDGFGRYPWSRTQGYAVPAQPVPPSMPQGYVQQGHGHHGGHHPGCGHQVMPAPAPQPVYYQSAPIHVSQPPIYVQAPPVYVEPAQVYVAPAQVEVAPAQVHVAPPQVQVAPAQIHYDQGYFAVPAEAPPPPPPPPPSSTERPYKQEPGERG